MARMENLFMINKILSDVDFKDGLKDSGPICIAFIFMSMSFGGFSKVTGFSLAQTMAVSMSVYSIPLQVIILQVFKDGLSLTSVALLSLIVNSRFFLMSLSLIPYFKDKAIKKLFPSLFILSASSFTVAHVKFTSNILKNPFRYYLGLALAAYFTNFVATLAGFYIMSSNSNSIMTQIFSIALGIHFTALTAMRWPKFKLILATLLGFLMMPLFSSFMQTNLSIIIIPVFVACFMIVLGKLEGKK